ncbi:MAG: hypothetical protein U0V70_00965 [Terriglobia bacterium]
MNLHSKLWLLLLAFTFIPSARGQSNSDIVLQHRVIANRLTAGEAGTVTLELSVEKGFKLGKRPAPKLQFTPNPNFQVTNRVSFEEASAGKDPEYFGEIKPLKISILPKKDLRTGEYDMDGKISFIYCSEKENYCARSSTDIKIPLIIAEK